MAQRNHGLTELLPGFDPKAKARADDPVQSKEAAAGAGWLAAGHQVKILDALAQLPDGGTPEEIADRCPWLQTHEVGKRLKELASAGLIVNVDGAERKHRNGRWARVWRKK